MKNKGYIITFSIYTVMFLADLVTTILNSDILPYAETNPLFRATSSIMTPVLVNVIVLGLLLLCIKAKPTGRFIVMNSMMAVIFVRGVAVYNNITWLKVPKEIVVQKAMEIQPEVIAAATSQFIYITYLPLVCGIITFLLWKLDHKVVKE